MNLRVLGPEAVAFYYHDDPYRGPAAPDRPLSWVVALPVECRDGAYEVRIRTNDTTDAARIAEFFHLNYDRVVLP